MATLSAAPQAAHRTRTPAVVAALGTTPTIVAVGDGVQAAQLSIDLSPAATSSQSELLWLEDSGCSEVMLVGGKAAQLSRLAGRHRVPPGFCLTAAAYDAARYDRSAHTSQLPPALHLRLAAAYQDLAVRCGRLEPRVAVRSSAIDEDGASASFAGQHETYLNITGIEALAHAILRCWRSLHAERALDYRRQHGLCVDGARLAVLVQQLVMADVSAVVFSANPLTGSRDEILINASWGLGESIVGGTVTPDTYSVRKADRSIIARRLAEKRRMTVLALDGTREVDVPRLLQRRPALDDAQVGAMAELAITLEEEMGWPVDVECAFASGQWYVLQCRPITTLSAASAATILD